MALDSAWIGVIGTGIGALAAGVPGVFSAYVQCGTAKAQREHDAAEAKAQREHDTAQKLRVERREMVDQWRTALGAKAGRPVSSVWRGIRRWRCVRVGTMDG